MPDVNLIEETISPDEPNKKPTPPAPPELTDPGKESKPKKIFGRLFHPAEPNAPAPKKDPSRMGFRKAAGEQRILNEKKVGAVPTLRLTEDPSEFDVNLLSEDLTATVDPKKRLLLFGLWLATSIVVVLVSWIAISAYEKELNQKVATLESEISQLGVDIIPEEEIQQQAVATEESMLALKILVLTRVRWTNVFKQIEKYTLPNVVYGKTFSASTEGSLSFQVVTDTFDTLAAQYLVYEKSLEKLDFITNFQISSAQQTYSDEGTPQVTFSVSMNLSPLIFFPDLLAGRDNSTINGSTR